jgi:hypothetical protein
MKGRSRASGIGRDVLVVKEMRAVTCIGEYPSEVTFRVMQIIFESRVCKTDHTVPMRITAGP